MFMRPYRSDDYESCVEVIDSSVKTYCFADHGNDEKTIVAWCEAANKGLDTLEYGVVVWTILNGVVGVGALEGNKITLNYVADHFTGVGISTRMLDSLEHYIKLRHYDEVLLISTVAARHMYRKRGYTEVGAPMQGNGVSWNFPMAKKLV